ncbi:MAG: hypothetical protein J1E34_10070, partial [Oscillospiraceae bacterium]|nr:hypothetical protein [Oscillospiraceae bacterium]
MNNISQNRYMVSSFGGINVHERINDGQWSDMLNMTADEYPTAKTRAQRMKFENNFNDEKYSAMFPGKPVDAAVVDDKIFIACDTGVVAQGEHIADTGQEVKQIVPFGRDIFISPGGYLLKNDFSDLAPVQIYASIVCNTSFCNSESEDIDVKSADNAPENPKNGDYWFDTTKNGLYRYSKTDENWISVTQMYVKFTLNSEEENNFNFGLFKAGDAIEAERTDGQKNNFIVHTVAGTGSYMTVEGYIAPSENTEWVFMRRCPVFDFVCEHNNRIWGCRYGENDKGEFVNEIYASALGDPTNFFVFEGTAADSYIASVGHAGVWTGCISTEEYVFFFKRDAVFIVSGSSPATYTISKIGDIGVQKGSEKSLKEISGYVYYKSDHGVMRINPGGFPSLISLALGADTMNEAIAGTNGTKYYMSALENGERKMFVYDISLGVWTKEDEPTDNLCAFISYKNDLIAIGGKINSVCARAGVTFDEEKAEEAKPKPGDYSGELAYQRYILALAAWKLKVVITKLYARTEYMEARHILFELGKGTKYSD